MSTEKIIDSLCELRDAMTSIPESLIQEAIYHNRWFTQTTVSDALEAIRLQYLDRQKLENWVDEYKPQSATWKVGIIMAGNIPLVGFHDLLCVLVAGHRAIVKLSDKDAILMGYIIEWLQEYNPYFVDAIQVVDRLRDYDAVIATGSNNTATYFKKYFGKVPHIIRQNRHAVAVLDGGESASDLRGLGLDVFTHYGLGCRNVSKVYIPQDYDLHILLEALHHFNEVVLHDKYKNNFDYNIALYMLNKVPFVNNGSIILLESADIASRIATLHYQRYEEIAEVTQDLTLHTDEIQCVVGRNPHTSYVPFGAAQSPALDDYADGIDTMAFLMQKI